MPVGVMSCRSSSFVDAVAYSFVGEKYTRKAPERHAFGREQGCNDGIRGDTAAETVREEYDVGVTTGSDWGASRRDRRRIRPLHRRNPWQRL